jgi:hypothetical protein
VFGARAASVWHHGWNVDEQSSPRAWFNDIGYRVDVSADEDGVWWAALTSLANPDYRIEKYGRGETEEQAAERARRRWQVEQIGSPSDLRTDERHLP